MPANNLRVLFVIPGDGAGSSMIFARRLLGKLQPKVDAAEAFFLGSRTSPIGVLREWRRLKRRIREFRPDIVHAQNGTMTGLLATAAFRPSVVTFRGSDLNPCPCQRLRSLAGRVLSHIAALRAGGIVCVSEQLRLRLKLLSPERITILPSGVDVSSFRPMDQAKARATLGWESDERIILFNGSSPVVKRLDLARAALAELRTRAEYQVRFEILTGAVDPELVPVMMNAADCLLLTSDYEGSPTVVQEAIACGLPVVSVDVGDVRQNLAGITPSHVVSRTPERLAQALRSILSSPSRSTGPQMVDRFSFDRIADELLVLYRNVTSAPMPVPKAQNDQARAVAARSHQGSE